MVAFKLRAKWLMREWLHEHEEMIYMLIKGSSLHGVSPRLLGNAMSVLRYV